MEFETYIPSDILKPYIKSFIISETPEESIYKVLPDTGVVIGFQYKGKLSHIRNDTETQLSSAGISGLHDNYRLFKNSENTGTILVFFKEAKFAAFFKQPIHEFFRESVSLDNIMQRSESVILEEQLFEATTGRERIDIIEKLLISRIRKTEFDNLVFNALALIHKSRGNIRIKDLIELLNISQSPLEKRFRQTVGTSPKKFASIVRFKHTIQNYNAQSSLTELGYDAGYYDQAHFIKEFKSLTGDTPEVFFGRK